MPSIHRAPLVVTSFLIAAAVCAAGELGTKELLERQSKVAEAEAAVKSYSAVATRTPLKLPDQPAPKNMVSTHRVGRRPGHILITSGKNLYCANPQYGFKLQKKDGGWLLGQVLPGTDSSTGTAKYPYEKHFGNAEAMAARPMTSFTSIESVFDLFAGETLAVEPTALPNEYLFKYSTPSQGGPRYERSVRCSFAADTSILIAAPRQSSSMPKYEYLFRRVLDAGGRVTSVEEVLVERGSAEAVQTQRCEFSDYTATAPQEGEFYLSHYNLPEPVGIAAPHGGGPGWWWSIPAVGAASAVAWFLLRRKGKS